MSTSIRRKAYKKETDSVPALLTPHEAVLNRRAADLLGRDKIRKLNAKGNAMERGGRKYQRGTSDVQSPEHEDQGESMMRQGVRFTPEDLDAMQKMKQAQDEARRKQALNEKPVFQFQSGTSDVKDLLRDTENTFYGGGQVPVPTPTPTPRRKYQFGTSNVVPYASNIVPYAQNQNAMAYTTAAGSPPTAAPTLTGTQTGGTGNTGNLSVTAGSFGQNSPFGNPVPNLNYANPQTLSRLNINDLVYSVPAGGYLTSAEANNANSYYNKFGSGGGGDPMANRQAAAYYNYIGSLPTRPIGTPALNQFYGMMGQQTAAGPSYNSILSNVTPGSFGSGYASQFGSTYRGPFGDFGQRIPGFNQYGSYKGSNNLGY